jgi:hypothetical protein
MNKEDADTQVEPNIDKNKTMTIVAFETNIDINLSCLEWTNNIKETNDIYYYDYESEPLFGSPTRHRGYISKIDGILLVAGFNGNHRSVAKQIIESPSRLTLTPTEQHKLISANKNSIIINASHPNYRSNLVEDMVLDSREERSVDDFRAEIREREFPIHKAHLQYNDERVKLFFGDVHCGTPATVNAFAWFKELLDHLEISNK